MRVSAVVSKVGRRFLAQCEEVERAGEGATPSEAIESLRAALEEYFGTAQAVAPPEQSHRETIDIVVIDGS